MSELTNLTDRISHLRGRKGSSPVLQGGGLEPRPSKTARARSPERRFATDYFMVFVYALLGVAVLTQFVLIVCFDIL